MKKLILTIFVLSGFLANLNAQTQYKTTDGFFSDLAAIDIGSAIAHLGEAEGISINQETVNKIFEKFCLGK